MTPLPAFFLTTERIGFSYWKNGDGSLAALLWGDPQVTRYICASGVYSPEDVQNRLQSEIDIREKNGVQYFPIFSLQTGELIGCCGLHPHGEAEYELGFHLRPQYWHQGYAAEAAGAAISYAFDELNIKTLFAGHNPKNTASGYVLKKLGFQYTRDEFYEPTGLYHPSYRLKQGLIH